MDEQQVPLDVVGVRVELPSSQPVLILRGIDSYDQEHHVAVVVGRQKLLPSRGRSKERFHRGR